MKHWGRNLLRPVAALAFLIILIKKGPFQLDQIKYIFSQEKVLITGFGLILLQFFLTAYRWKLFVDTKAKISAFLAFKLTLIGQFFSFFIPGGVGGDIVKALELSKLKSLSRSDTLSTVLADRIFGLFAMVLFSSLFLAIDFSLEHNNGILKYLAFSTLLLLAMFVGLMFGRVVVQMIYNFFGSKENKILLTLQKMVTSFDLTFTSFRNKKLVSFTVLLSLVLQVISIYFMSLVVESLGVSIPSYLIFFSLCCFGFLASAIPITPAGIGVGQAAFYFLFAAFSEDLGKAAVTAISALQLFQFFYAIIGGIIFSASPLLRKNIQAEQK
ncbi:MAG: flippase-like domain-containing protein [Bdellovibrio sp.]|nr:flippase-like domain-containing protein [Bdellovibrio sp.]